MPDQRSPDRGYLLPYVTDPDRISVCVPVPDDINHRAAFLGALYTLTWAKNWEHDGTPKGKDVSLVWSEIYHEVSDKLGVELCEGFEPRCRVYSNLLGIIEYGPNDPRYTPDLVPDGYASPPWYFATTASNIAFGSHTGDIITSFERLPIVLPPGGVLVPDGWPWIKINLNGSGVVRVYLRALALGSMFIVTRSDNPLSFQFVDVNTDTVQAPPETHNEIIFEAEFETPAQHWLQFNIVPAIDLEEAPVTYGGGITKIELCGFGLGVESMDDCCGDISDIKQGLIRQENRRREDSYDDMNPSSVNPAAPDDYFSGDGSPEREGALCFTIYWFLGEILTRGLSQKCGGGALEDALNLVISLLTGNIVGTVVGGVQYVQLVGECNNLLGASGNQEVWDAAMCAVYNAFDGVEISEENFNDTWATISHGNPSVDLLLDEFANFAPGHDNYLYFVDLLGETYEWPQDVADIDCCPDIGCSADLDLTFDSFGADLPLGSWVPSEGMGATQLVSGFYELHAIWDIDGECMTGNTQLTLEGTGPLSSGSTWYILYHSGSPVFSSGFVGWSDGVTGPHALHAGPGNVAFDAIGIRHERTEGNGSSPRITRLLLEPIP